MAANLCTDRLRKRARLAPLEAAGEPAEPSAPVDARLQDAQRRRALGAALMQLTARQRLAVVLRHIEELPNFDIAETMDISVEAVESLTARGRAALARALADRKEALGYE